MWHRSVFAVAFLFPLPCLGQQPSFDAIEVPPHEYVGGWEHFVGGGLAAFDCDGDHLPELMAAGGANPASLFRNRSTRGGALLFEKEILATPQLRDVTGLYPIDIDSDGLLDLVVLRVGSNALLKGDGNCGFAELSDLRLLPDDRWTTAFSAVWEDNAPLPTLAIGNYVDRSDPAGPFGTCDENHLYRPKNMRYDAPLVLEPGHCPLSMLFSDWGRQGRADLRISNDRHYYVKDGQEQMWAMEAAPQLYSPQDGWETFKLWGMGIASRDVTGDGLPEVYLTSMGDQKFQGLVDPQTGPAYQTVPFAMGTAAHRPYTGDDGRPSTGWHVSFGDVQNDGLDDIFVAKGNVEQMPGSAMQDPNNLLIQHEMGSFEEQGDRAGIASFHRSRGAVLADLNLDGRLDLAVNNRRALLEVYQNRTKNTGNWLGLDIRQSGVNTRSVGAWIEVDTGARVYAREVTVGGGHAGGSAVPAHFGLGDVNDVNVRLIWPDQTSSLWQKLTVNRYIRLERSGSEFNVVPY